MEYQTMSINLEELKRNGSQLTGACSGVYFLFNNDDLVYVGEGWNCFLRVAEHTRKDRFKEFTSWNFIHMKDKMQRKDLERQVKREFKPKYNKR
jgi:excinuclease UvrABC nuclease subunit